VKGRGRRFWSVIGAATTTLAALAVLYGVWRSKDRADLATFGGFATAVVVLVLGWVAWLWRAGTGAADQQISGPDLDVRADLLAEAVLEQWTRAAGERGLLSPEPIPVRWGTPALPLTGPVAAAVASRRFEPLPGVPSVDEAQLADGQIEDLHAVYAGLRSGRLVIAGPAGSGKSGAAVLLLLAALRHREQVGDADRPRVPVPLLFTTYDWDPATKQIGEWLAEQLGQTYPMFDNKAGAADAAALVARGRIALILDGLDETAEEFRPVALQALSRQAAFRVVVLSRTAEMALAASGKGILEGAAAVELRPIDPDAAADYLSRVQLDPPPDGWRELVERVRSRSALAQPLDNPLTLTLVRDTYLAGDDARELVEFSECQERQTPGGDIGEEITDYLLDRVLPTAYEHRSGGRRAGYDLQVAQRAFAKIAAHMNEDQTRDLQWWSLPQWAPVGPRALLLGLTVGLVVGLAGLAAGLVVGLVGFSAGFACGLGLGMGLGRDLPPDYAGKVDLRRILSRKSLLAGLRLGPLCGLAIGVGRAIRYGLGAGLVLGLELGLGLALTIMLLRGLMFAMADRYDTRSLGPLASWRADRRHALIVGLLVGLVVGLAGALIVGIVSGLGVGAGASFAADLRIGLEDGLKGGLLFGLLSALVIGIVLAASWHTWIASAQLAWRWNIPARLMPFLEDARKRGVLRTVGPVYQFRHARLQDRLAEQAGNLRATSIEARTRAPLRDSGANVLQAD
jgi:hypothetical protein